MIDQFHSTLRNSTCNRKWKELRVDAYLKSSEFSTQLDLEVFFLQELELKLHLKKKKKLSNNSNKYGTFLIAQGMNPETQRM